jgi:hypothetical protein
LPDATATALVNNMLVSSLDQDDDDGRHIAALIVAKPKLENGDVAN